MTERPMFSWFNPHPRRAALIFCMVGAGLLIFFFVWIFGLPRYSAELATPSVLPLGSAFDNSSQLPINEFKSKFDGGVKILDQYQTAAVKDDRIGFWAEAASFCFTSVLTLLAALAGLRRSAVGHYTSVRSDASTHIGPVNLDDITSRRPMFLRSQNLIVLVGMLAILASASTASAGVLRTYSRRRLKAAQELSYILAGARRDWFNAKTPEDAQHVLVSLEEELRTHQ